MPREDEAWQQHLESSTRAVGATHRELDGVELVALTILCHPDPERVGERAVLTELPEGGVMLSRREPLFAQPRGGSPRPLADPSLSRTPWIVSPAADGVVLDPGSGRMPLAADGEPVGAARTVSGPELERGVVLVLARRIALVLHLTDAFPDSGPDHGLIGESNGIRRLRSEIRRVAEVDFPVLLRGESGTGKELAARAIHDAGPRRDRPYLAVNVGAIPPTLAAAELFGAARGAFSGADRRRPGYFERASGGSLFLDEIGTAPSDVQVMLLRVLETGQVQPVGAEEPRAVDVRILSATDADLEAASEAGDFRAPLLHRLAGYEIVLPPLRERRDDIGRLFFHFLRQELAAIGEDGRLRGGDEACPFVPAELVARLGSYDWPANVRQLRNVVRQVVVASRGRSEAVLPPRVERLLGQASRPGAGAPRRREKTAYRDPDTVGEAELREALRSHRWEVRAAAAELRLSSTSLYDLMKQFGIRTASEITREEIDPCRRLCDGDVEAMAERLEVSKRGLKIRMKKLTVDCR